MVCIVCQRLAVTKVRSQPPTAIATREWPVTIYSERTYAHRLSGPAIGFFWSGMSMFTSVPRDSQTWSLGLGETGNGKLSLRLDRDDHRGPALAAADFVGALTSSLYLAHKPRWGRKLTPPLRSFHRGAEVAAVMLAPLASSGDKTKGKRKVEIERGVVGTLRADVYQLALYDARAVDAAEIEIAALLAEGYVERPGPGTRSWPTPPQLTGVISWTGADGSRLDVSLEGDFADRIQFVSASRELVFRSHRRDVKEHEFTLVLEYPGALRSKLLTAMVAVNRGGELTRLWHDTPVPAEPDPSPLPV